MLQRDGRQGDEAIRVGITPRRQLLVVEVELAGPEGSRRLPLDEFYGKDGRWTVSEEHPGGLRPGELLLRVRVPLPEAGWHGVYDGLSDEQIDEIEAIALDRSGFMDRGG